MSRENARLATERGLWGDAYRELLRPRTVAIALVGVALFVVAMTIFGPLGTLEALGPLRRFGYWALCAGITFPLCYAWAAVVLDLSRRRSLVEMVPAVAAAVLFEGLLCTAVVMAADVLFVPAHAPPLDLVNTYVTVTVVVAMCTLFAHYGVVVQIGHRRAAAADRPSHDMPQPRTAVPASGPPADREQLGPPQPLTPQQERFHDRLSRAVSRDVVYLEMNDHYVNVCTTGGSCLVLMRFADAVADLGALGMQVHRSYWVAHRHMLRTVRRERRTMLRVTGGRDLPISRPYLPAVRAALSAQPSRSGAVRDS